MYVRKNGTAFSQWEPFEFLLPVQKKNFVDHKTAQ